MPGRSVKPDAGRALLLDHGSAGGAPLPRVARRIVDQLGVDRAHDVALGLRLAVRRIEHLQIGVGAHPEDAGVLCEAEAGPRGGSQAERGGALEQGAAGQTKPLHAHASSCAAGASWRSRSDLAFAWVMSDLAFLGRC